jgi:hypothetical protein
MTAVTHSGNDNFKVQSQHTDRSNYGCHIIDCNQQGRIDQQNQTDIKPGKKLKTLQHYCIRTAASAKEHHA